MLQSAAWKKPDKQLTLSDGSTVSLWKDAKFLNGSEVICTGDHMIVEHKTGHTTDVVILRENGRPTVKGLVHKMEIPSGKGGLSFEDLDEHREVRYLNLHERISKA